MSGRQQAGLPGPPSPGGKGAVAALDPGSAKCGLVLSDGERRRIVRALVMPPEQAWQQLEAWGHQPGLAAVVIGDGTGAGRWCERLAGRWPVVVQPERGTTLAARRRYWQLLPARGWRRCLPEGLRLPPRDWDDVVAQLLLERWLGRPLERAAGAEPGNGGSWRLRTPRAR
jgi:RNase H-fold protein (predicted Holliday junction resolvase)